MEIITRQAKWSKMESNFKFIMKKLVSGLFQVFHFLREITGANQVGLWYAWSNASAAISFFHVRIILKAKTKRSFKGGWCVAHRNNLLSKLLWGICRRFHCSALNQFKLRAADWTDESTGVLLPRRAVGSAQTLFTEVKPSSSLPWIV